MRLTFAALCRPFRCSDLHTVELDMQLGFIRQTGLAQNRLLGVVVGSLVFSLSELKINAAIASESINWKTESLKVTEFYKLVMDSI